MVSCGHMIMILHLYIHALDPPKPPVMITLWP